MTRKDVVEATGEAGIEKVGIVVSWVIIAGWFEDIGANSLSLTD